MYSSNPEDDETSSPETLQSPTLTQRTKPGSYGKACDICRKKKARCNFEQPRCGYCRAFRHECTYNAAAACANRRNAKKLSIETKRQQRPPPPARAKSTGGSLVQPFSADPNSQSGYLTPVTPLDRRLHSTGASYHSSRAPELLGSPVATGHRSTVYSPESTSPTASLTRSLSAHQEPNMAALNGHGATRYQPQHIRPYGQSSNSYLPEAARAMLKADTDQRANTYMEMPYIEHQGKEHAAQAQMMQHTASDPPHSFSHSDMHHDEQIERVVSPANHSSMGQFPQYQGYEQYHHRVDMDPGSGQHDTRHQLHQDWASRRQSIPVPNPDERSIYRYHAEVESQNTYSLR